MDGYYEGPLRYVGIVEVRAANSFGAYLTQKYVIEGEIRGDIKLICEYNRVPLLGNVDWDFYEEYNAQVSRTRVPNYMADENKPNPLL